MTDLSYPGAPGADVVSESAVVVPDSEQLANQPVANRTDTSEPTPEEKHNYAKKVLTLFTFM